MFIFIGNIYFQTYNTNILSSVKDYLPIVFIPENVMKDASTCASNSLSWKSLYAL